MNTSIDIRLGDLTDIDSVAKLLEIRDNKVYDREILTNYLQSFKPEKVFFKYANQELVKQDLKDKNDKEYRK